MKIEDQPRRGVLASLFGGLWWLVDGTRRLVVNLLFLFIVVAVLFAVFGGSAPRLAEKTVLVLDLAGPLVEQRSGSARDAALGQLQGQDAQQTRLRDVIAALDAAAREPRITSVLLALDGLSGGGLTAQREVSSALVRFRSGGKKVVAWGTSYDQRQYYIAAHADEVYLHPMGMLTLTGYGRLRNYYREAFDRLGVSANVVRVGKFKNAAEPYFANAPSPETLESEGMLYNALWSLYTDGVEKARKLPAGTLGKAIDALPGSLVAVGGDVGRLALQSKLVDGLKTRDELRKLLVERGTEDAQSKSFRQIDLHGYLARIKPQRSGDAVAVVVAEGEIGDGLAPPGRIGGRSTADLIRKARDDGQVKAIVLRVNSPGGSALGSEMVRRELELVRGVGKPVIVSMGDLAASGGYWISMAADEVIADPATITGSIGVFGMLPTAEGLMDKVSVRTGGISTTWLGTAYDPRKALDPRYEQLIQSSVDHIYADFTGKAAAARKTTPQKIDEVAQGRVWSGAQALQRGLVDRVGSFADALSAARARAQLPEDARVTYVEQEPGRLQTLLGFLDSAVLQGAVQGAAQGALQALGLPAVGTPLAAGALRDLRDDLGGLAGLATPGHPFAAVVHCLCEPAW